MWPPLCPPVARGLAALRGAYRKLRAIPLPCGGRYALAGVNARPTAGRRVASRAVALRRPDGSRRDGGVPPYT